jgi:hypothetical protein
VCPDTRAVTESWRDIDQYNFAPQPRVWRFSLWLLFSAMRGTAASANCYEPLSDDFRQPRPRISPKPSLGSGPRAGAPQER